MTINDALALASDCHVGQDRDNVDCLFVYGEGIELRSDGEVELAKMVVESIEVLAAHIKSKGTAKPLTAFMAGGS